jgi:GNAT superfamily N-acetyltransferase
VTLKDFETYFGKSRVICEDSYPHYYLDPINFTPASRRDDVIIRRLAQSEYNRLHELFDACKEHDIDEADIWLDRPDPVVFCGFMDETIVAYASHRYLSAYGDDRCFGDEIAELGVLIHPDYRGKGLGKAVISALSQWCIDHDKIPQYQTNQSHVGSRRIPESLRYTRLFDVLLIEVKP